MDKKELRVQILKLRYELRVLLRRFSGETNKDLRKEMLVRIKQKAKRISELKEELEKENCKEAYTQLRQMFKKTEG